MIKIIVLIVDRVWLYENDKWMQIWVNLGCDFMLIDF